MIQALFSIWFFLLCAFALGIAFGWFWCQFSGKTSRNEEQSEELAKLKREHDLLNQKHQERERALLEATKKLEESKSAGIDPAYHDLALQKNQELSAQLEALKATNSNLESQVTALAAPVAAVDGHHVPGIDPAEHDRLVQQNQELQAELESIKATNSQPVDDGRIAQLESEKADLQRAHDDAVERANALEQKLAASSEHVAPVRAAEVDSLKARVRELETQLMMSGHVVSKIGTDLIQIQDLDSTDEEKLVTMAGIRTQGQLLEVGSTAKGRAEIANRTGLDLSAILRWVNCVDLQRVSGVTAKEAHLLELAGVDTVVELARRRPDTLTAKISEQNTIRTVLEQVPTEEVVMRWVEEAKTLPRVVSY